MTWTSIGLLLAIAAQQARPSPDRPSADGQDGQEPRAEAPASLVPS